MKQPIFIFITIFLSLISVGVYAQDKTQAYYAQHEREILPDAQTAFSEGNYERAAQLCRWHYIIVGDHAADSLRDLAESCQELLEEMNSLILQNENETALEKALALLALNPEDSDAKQLLLAAESVVSETVEEEIEITPDSVSEEDLPAFVVEPIVVPESERPKQVTVEVEEVPQRISQTLIQPTDKVATSYKTKFGVKAAVSLLDLNPDFLIAYGGSLGLYDIGGSRLGAEVGVLISPTIPNITSFYELDAGITLRITDWIYTKIITGVFKCKLDDSSTKGMCGGVDASFALTKHFFIEVGGKYYPSISVVKYESATTAGLTYEIPYVINPISGGLSPNIGIGFLF